MKKMKFLILIQIKIIIKDFKEIMIIHIPIKLLSFNKIMKEINI
jgi:hypothetical protein